MLQSESAQASVIVAPGLSCPAAHGILVPRPGIEPLSPALEGRFLTTGPPGKPPGESLSQYNWCPYIKGKFGQTNAQRRRYEDVGLAFFFKGRRKRKKKWQKSLNWKFRLPVKIDKEGICLLQHLMKGTKIHDIDFEKTWPSK